ncbi:hypothetical protein HaLaN_25511 [Haematococcus lacustris]|uniref:Uncharacterized protein n=1 Tax=Haematococcus lacustris TaxID=44745 RepID=A0A699ZX07_HAELA|nr:hypothetical protein HaLaN_25511 [Haematococcus lacustris]
MEVEVKKEEEVITEVEVKMEVKMEEEVVDMAARYAMCPRGRLAGGGGGHGCHRHVHASKAKEIHGAMGGLGPGGLVWRSTTLSS